MLLAQLIALPILYSQAQTPAYLDINLPFEKRAADLVSRMTVPEKISQMQNVAPAIPRLNIPAYDWWNEALHGVCSPGYSTVFPQAIGNAASFNVGLMRNIATAISDEGRAKNREALAKGQHGMHQGLTFWAPNINIFRDPRWGRGQETYGEDPYLTSRMAVAFVSSMQGKDSRYLKTVSTPKHYAVHSGPEPLRHRFNAIADLRDMYMTYFPAFEAAVKEAKAYSIMSAYNRTNDLSCTASPFLLTDTLRKRWGFKGYVVSDCGAVWDVMTGHHLANTRAEAAALALKAGCDLECGDAYAALGDALKQGLVTESDIDVALNRLFEARMRLGMFDPADRVPYNKIPLNVVDSPKHRAIALQAARESLVLLRNEGGILPLKGAKKIAVIGPHANDRIIPLGNYNGSPSKLVTLLEGIRNQAPKGTEIQYDQGCGVANEGILVPIPAALAPNGFKGEYFDNQRLQGEPKLVRNDKEINFDWGEEAAAKGLPADYWSARWTGTIIPEVTGDYLIGTKADDGARLWVDGKQVVNDWRPHAETTNSAKIHLEAGKPVSIRFEFFDATQFASAKLVWRTPLTDPFADTIKVAQASDLVILTLGISGDQEGEEHDRNNIDLPEVQQRLLKAVLDTGKPVVVVLESGSMLVVDDPRIKAILQAWYPGEEGGNAVGEVLFGKYSPAGRLPVTYYKSLAQVPTFTDYKMEGRTYRYFRQEPRYGFGYGLSYSQFAYSNVTITPKLHVEATVKNTGAVDADEVVQVYVQRKGAAWPEPKVQLAGFQRIHLKKGASAKVGFDINPRQMSVADEKGNFTVPKGEYIISVGGGQPGLEPATSGKVTTATIVK